MIGSPSSTSEVEMCRVCGQEAGYESRTALFEVFECKQCGTEFKQELEGRYAALRKAIDQAILKLDVEQPAAASRILQYAIQARRENKQVA